MYRCASVFPLLCDDGNQYKYRLNKIVIDDEYKKYNHLNKHKNIITKDFMFVPS